MTFALFYVTVSSVMIRRKLARSKRCIDSPLLLADDCFITIKLLLLFGELWKGADVDCGLRPECNSLMQFVIGLCSRQRRTADRSQQCLLQLST